MKKNFILIVAITALLSGYGMKHASAETQKSDSVLYVPLIGLISVPNPLVLPEGTGEVTYKYAVKNFLQEVPLGDIQVVDDTCGPVKFVEGDDNHDGKLDFEETWRYSCTVTLSKTTQSTATAMGTAHNITATHKAYATVIAGSPNPPPLVNIINITKVAYPLSLPPEGGEITFTYKVNNPGIVPLSDVMVNDDKCSSMSGKLGDTNGNNLLDTNEVWIYTCTTNLIHTTTNTVTVEAVANGLKAFGAATITVKVDSTPRSVPNLPETGMDPDMKITVWATFLSGVSLGIVISVLIAAIILILKRKFHHKTEKYVPLTVIAEK